MRTFILLFLLFCGSASAQENFQWDKVIETEKSKQELYSNAKSFIAETWKSAKDVIQNDDQEGGLIILKGISTQNFSFNTSNNVYYVYRYTMKIYVKENKTRVVISDVFCERGEHSNLKLIQPNDTEYPKYYKPERCRAMQENLRMELSGIVKAYEASLNKTVADW
jgi:outer membrane lipoprotein-sorting protein